VDEYPYTKAIEAGTKLVMVNSARYPALDREWPASMSRRIVHHELRGRLGFRGVTITDALEGGGLIDVGNIPRRAVRAARVGMDLLLFSKQTLNEGAVGCRALRRALRAGRLDREAYERSALRVLRLRRLLSGDGAL
jgi:beta-N-acetylhexosaminidase